MHISAARQTQQSQRSNFLCSTAPFSCWEGHLPGGGPCKGGEVSVFLLFVYNYIIMIERHHCTVNVSLLLELVRTATNVWFLHPC